MDNMEGLTVAEIADRLGITPDTAKKRLQKHGIKASRYAGPTALYDPEVVDVIKDSNPVGRPKKPTEPESES